MRLLGCGQNSLALRSGSFGPTGMDTLLMELTTYIRLVETFMSRAKQLALYTVTLAAVVSITYIFNSTHFRPKPIVAEVVENPTLLWINNRQPTQADCGNRAGLVWVYNGGKAKLRFYHNVNEGVWWATIKEPIGPREKWIDNIIEAVEGDHCHVTQ